MMEIARDADVAVGTLYLYFKNKDELVVGTADQFAYKHKRFVDQLLRSTLPADEKLVRYIVNRFRALEETRTSIHAAEIARAVVRLKPERLDEEDKWIRANLVHIIEEGNTSDTFNVQNPSHDAEILLISLRSFLPVAGMEPYRAPTEIELLKLLDWFLSKWRMPT